MPPTTTASPFFGSAPEPKLMTVEPMHLKDVRAAEQQELHGYGWVDEKAGVARIPIDEAKKLTLERGLAVRPDPLTDERLGTRRRRRASRHRDETLRARSRPQPRHRRRRRAAAPAQDGTRHAQVEHVGIRWLDGLDGFRFERA